MKKFTFLFAALVAFVVLATSFYPSGSPGGKTGSPGDGANCTQCHSGTTQSATGWISSDIPANGYVPGNTYTITLVASHPGAALYGFEMTSEDVSNAKKGVFASTSGATQALSSGNSITHHFNGTTPSNDSIMWSFNWTAPVAGTGDVTFYAAVNAANGNNSPSGDQIYLMNNAVGEQVVTSVESFDNDEISVYPNPASDYLMVNNLSPDTKTVKIVSMSGQIIAQYSNEEGSMRIDLSTYPKGIYFLLAQDNTNTIKRKFMVR